MLGWTDCSKQYARADWDDHKLTCGSLRKALDEGLAAHEAHGVQKKGYRQSNRDFQAWFEAVPGLSNEIMLLAWKRRRDSPLLQVSTSQTVGDGIGIQFKLMPRSFWDQDPRFIDTFSASTRDYLRQTSDASSSGPNKD